MNEIELHQRKNKSLILGIHKISSKHCIEGIEKFAKNTLQYFKDNEI
jgi:hypothetical protein